jgi:hypothetical protein
MIRLDSLVKIFFSFFLFYSYANSKEYDLGQ